jgi:uncharacterized membrane protein YfcA
MVFAAFLSSAVGLLLGLLGGGGSILAVPVLVYAAHIAPRDAVAMSLALVGTTALMASFAHARSRQVDGRVAVLFGGAGVIGSFIGARFTDLVSGRVLLIAFGALMVVVGAWIAYGQLRSATEQRRSHRSLPRAVAAAVGVGLLTGFLGVGGGFLIVPALIAFAGLDMRRAIGTSLVVIVINSAAGFLAHFGKAALPVAPTVLFTAVAVMGALLGERLASRIPAVRLRHAFSIFVLAVGVFVIVHAFASIPV